MLGEDPVKQSDRKKCDTNVLPDARSEGSEYEGEVKVVNLTQYHIPKTSTNPILPGYIYDIGPDSVKALQGYIQAADVVMQWGTSGMCEVNSFQTSQQAIIQSINSIKSNTVVNGVIPINNGCNVIVWGENTVEWYTRFIDSDGELEGDLVGRGSSVTYMNRDVSLFKGIIGRYHSALLKNKIQYRVPQAGEWIYTLRRPEEEEEEEEEDEEEEEEED